MQFPFDLLPATARPFDLVAFGENSVDVVARTGDLTRDAGVTPADKRRLSAFDILTGGQATTAAIACARLGARARYAGVVGDDEWGGWTGQSLRNAGVDACTVVARGARSRTAIVLVDDRTGERTVLEHRPAALGDAAARVPSASVTAGRILLVDAVEMRVSISLAQAARSAGVATMVDVDRVTPEVADLLQHIDVIVVPEAFLTTFTNCAEPGPGLRALTRRFHPALAIVTLGAGGSLARSGDAEIRTPGFAVEVRDTTGAGDAFRGGLAAAWVKLGDCAPLEDVLAYANAAAALNCRGIGAQRGLPVWEDVQRLVTRQPEARSNQAGSPDVGTTE